MPLMIRDFGIKDVVSVSLYTVVPNAIGAIGLVLIARGSTVLASGASTSRSAPSLGAWRLPH
jgi:hypothetical protein